MDAMQILVKHICGVRFSDLPEEVIASTRLAVLDTLGVILAGSSVPGCRVLINYLRRWGGRSESTVAVWGDHLPCGLAAQANGAMSRAHEIDDVLDTFPLHPSASIIPACLSAAQHWGKISGQDFLAAVALGHDLIVRLAHSVRVSPIVSGRYNLFDIFAVTGAVGKIWKISETNLMHAMGIAYSQMVGDAKAGRDGVMTSYIQQGTKAKSAIEAVLMAVEGITGTRDVLEGPCGFYSAYEPDPHIDQLLDQIGLRYGGSEVAVKLYSACRATHIAIDLALAARTRGIETRHVATVTVRVNDSTYALVCHPLDEKRRPRTPVAAQFSLPFALATALIKGRVFIDEMSPEALEDPETLSLASRITPVRDLGCKTDLSVGAVQMELKTLGGERLVLDSDCPQGNPRRPASLDTYVEKFRKCAGHAAVPFSLKQIDALVEMITHLEQLDDLTRLAQLLVPST